MENSIRSAFSQPRSLVVPQTPIADREPMKKSVTKRKVVLLEFNELSPMLMSTFIARGELPNFSRLRDSSHVFITDAEEPACNLEPWIQWPTVHSGLSFDQHGIFHLGDGHNLSSPQVWDLISEAGHKVWICGSMNIRSNSDINGAIVPDPWTTSAPPVPPAKFDDYYRFIQRNVQEYTNDHVPLSARDYMRFLRFMVTHGLSSRTSGSILRQLLTERANPKSRWQRATVLDKLQWDLFKHVYKKERPAFSTFFLNSTAHFQHMYWRNMDPGSFTLKPSADDQRTYEDAILYGYKEMDRIVGEALSLTSDGRTILIMLSALGQQPCLTYENSGGKTFYRPRVFDRVLEFVGAKRPYRVEPVMSEQFHIRFENETAADASATALKSLSLPGRPAMLVQRNGADVFAGCNVFEQLPHDVILTGPEGRSTPFFRLFYQVEGLKSGMHHPDGILWIRDPSAPRAENEERVSLRDVAPTLLAYFDIDPPPAMTGHRLNIMGDMSAQICPD